MRSFLIWLLCLSSVFLGLWAGFVGWHQVACSQGLSDAFGWGLVALLVSPLAVPPVGLTAITSLIFAPFALQSHIRANGKYVQAALWSVAAWAGAFIACNLAARAMSAHARCGIGF
jgi:hypothetical protein